MKPVAYLFECNLIQNLSDAILSPFGKYELNCCQHYFNSSTNTAIDP